LVATNGNDPGLGVTKKEGRFDPVRSKLITGETDADSAMYQNPDGSTTSRQSLGPVRFKSGTDAWVEIDSRISRKADGSFAPASVEYPVTVRSSREASGVQAEVATSGGVITILPSIPTVALGAVGSKAPPSALADKSAVEANRVEFAGAAGTVRYEQLSTGVKESVVFTTPEQGGAYESLLRLPKGVTARQTKTGIEFVAADKVVATYGGGSAWGRNLHRKQVGRPAIPRAG
jgi:hypothetical protein